MRRASTGHLCSRQPRLPATSHTAAERTVTAISKTWTEKKRWLAQKAFYDSIRALFGHPENSAVCGYCGVREHHMLHHEADFSREVTPPSVLRVK